MFVTRGERDREIGKRGAKETDGKGSGLWEKRGEEGRGEEGRKGRREEERAGTRKWVGKGGNGRSGKRRGGMSAVWRIRDVYPGSRIQDPQQKRAGQK
jgi:hypothetical protein